MQRITITLTTAKGVVIKKTLTKSDHKPVELSLPPGTRISVDVVGPPAKPSAKAGGVHKLITQRYGQDLVFEGEGDKQVRVINYYGTKDVSIGATSWDYGEPLVASSPSASGLNAAPSEANVASSTSASTTGEGAAPAEGTPPWGLVLLGGLAGGGGGGPAAPATASTVDVTTSVTPVNSAPILAHPLTNHILIIGSGATQSFQLPADTFTDVDSPVLTYAAHQIVNGVETSLPSWLSFDPATLTFTASHASAGVITVRVTASDGTLTAVSDFDLNAVNTLSSLNTPQLTLLNDTGVSSTDGWTSNGTVMVNGLVIGAAWQYSLDNGATWLTGTGNSFDLPAQDGRYALQVKQSYGAIASGAGTLTVQLDTSVEASTVAGFDTLGKTSDLINAVNLTDMVGTAMTHTAAGKQALLEGTSEAGATVTFMLGGQSKTATADATGYWNYRLSASDFANVGVGAEQITITTVTDKAGNVNRTAVTRNVTFNAIADTVSHPDAGYGSGYIDTLVYGGAGWDGRTLTYCFTPGVAGTTEWTSAEKQVMRAAFDSYEHICNLKFVEGSYTTSIYTQTSLELTKVDASHWAPQTGVLGSFYIPGDGYNGWYGSLDGYFNYDTNSWKTSLIPGGDAYYTLIHELGHALGMNHPFDDIQKFPGVNATLDVGVNNLNQGIWTVMSYSADWNTSPKGHTYLWGEAKTPMTFDIATMQTLYGANMQYRTSDDVYVLPTSNVEGTGWECLWDAGGIDTISNAGAASSCVINLNPYPKTGGVVSEPFVSYNTGILQDGTVVASSKIAGGFTIADGVTIENAIGGNGNDVLVGNAVNNELTGDAGNDTLTGGAGADTFIFKTALGATNVDTITDFTASEGDSLQLSASIFSQLTIGFGLTSGQLLAGAGVTAASNASQFILYNTTTGNLYYDSDGSGAAAAICFAVLQNKPTDLTVNQFTVI